MDDFGDNFVQPEVDPAAEFLAREQNQLAGLEDELETSAPPPVALSTASNGFDDFVGNCAFDTIIVVILTNSYTIFSYVIKSISFIIFAYGMLVILCVVAIGLYFHNYILCILHFQRSQVQRLLKRMVC